MSAITTSLDSFGKEFAYRLYNVPVYRGVNALNVRLEDN